MLNNQYIPPAVIQKNLLILAFIFLGVMAVALTFSPAARLRTWDVDLRWSHWAGLAFWAICCLVTHYLTRRLPNFDPYILPIAALLAGWGLLTIWRVTVPFGWRQTAWIVASFTILLGWLNIPQGLDTLRRYKYLWLAAGLLLTALTLFFGSNPAETGPRLWLGCCGIYLQPSEPLKLLLVTYLAAYFAEKHPIRHHFLHFILPTLFVTGLALAILLIQRDLGAAFLFIFIYATMLYLVSGKKRILAISGILLLGAGAVGYFLSATIEARVDSWLNPWNDPSGRSYQIIQSLLAIANGGIFGRGLGLGSPGLVPIAHSDFIFTSLAEETGLVGSLALFTLLGLLTLRGFIIALRAQGLFQRLLAGGLTISLAAQSLLIIGGNLRLLPLTGVTLPFVSYGGSSLATSFLAIGILLVISANSEDEPAPLENPTPYLAMAALLGIGFLSAALINGWWAAWRNEDLLLRTDNPRRAISDRYVKRGNLLDRNNNPINETQGETGTLTRIYHYPDLSPITGYIHPVYGQAGLEDSLDPYLRGLKGNPSRTLWWERLLYGQPPPGLNVRLSISLPLQREADQALGKSKGALVLINAQTGEVLAIASHPTFNPSELDENATALLQNPDSPLLNRALRGQYSPGMALAPLLFAAGYGGNDSAVDARNAPPAPLDCALPPDGNSIPNQVRAGCRSAWSALENEISWDAILAQLSLPQKPLDEVQISPQTLAQALAALSNGGEMPPARLTLAVETPEQGWVLLASEPNIRLLSAQQADWAASALAVPGKPYWEASACENVAQENVCWYLGGYLPDFQGTRLAVVVVLQANQPLLAREIGRAMLEKTLTP